MPTSYNYAGERLDSQTGLLYDNFRYYDAFTGRFVRSDNVQDNSNGMDPYAYVGDNPETRNDPSGHCWPLCTMIIGALVGAAISVATTVVSNAVQGKPTSLGEIAQSAVVGAVSGAISGLAGPEAGPVAKMAIGALSAGAGQMASNAMSGKPLMDGVGQAAAVGGITGGLMEGAGSLLKGGASEVGEAAESELSEAGSSCGLSFRADTPVETPTGEQPIGTLHVGDHVQAYNPTTKTVSTQTVQQVFINHDTDLIDVTLAVQPAHTQSKTQQVAVVSHGSHAPPVTTEVVHTTQKHPWLTTTGWITAGQLQLGDHVQQLDGSTATVVGLKIIAGSAPMYDLTVSDVHTFAVGDGQFVVHNCGDSSPLAKPSEGEITNAKGMLNSLKELNRSAEDNPAATATWETDRGFVLTDSGTDVPENEAFGNCGERQYLGVTSKIGASPLRDDGVAQMYEFQVNGQMPCSSCTQALMDASSGGGPIRVWGGLNKFGGFNLQYQDFVDGQSYGPYSVE